MSISIPIFFVFVEIDSIKALLKDLLDENSTPSSPIPEVNVADYDVDDGDSSRYCR